MKEYGTKRNVAKDERYLLDALEAGDWHALLCIANCYKRGIGVAVNKKKALALYQRGFSKWTMYNFEIGKLYMNGGGSRVNLRKVIHHFSIIVDGRTDGNYRKDYHRLSIDGVGRDDEKAHSELAKILEKAKGNRALHHIRSIADRKNRKTPRSNGRVANYFVIRTLLRRLILKIKEFQRSSEQIRKIILEKAQNEAFDDFYVPVKLSGLLHRRRTPCLRVIAVVLPKSTKLLAKETQQMQGELQHQYLLVLSYWKDKWSYRSFRNIPISSGG